MYQGQYLDEGISMINTGYKNRFNQMIQDRKINLIIMEGYIKRDVLREFY